MPDTLEVRPCPKPGHVIDPKGKVVSVPQGWTLLPPGDALLTRRVKAAGPHWVMKRLRKNRLQSMGVWADEKTIEKLKADVSAEKADPAYQKRLEAGRKRREKEQEVYEQDFEQAIRLFLNFAPRYAKLADQAASAITRHAIPVGSGTVARTQRIPIEERARAATIAWMRHQTTGYDDMYIPLVKGQRREVRRNLAQKSLSLLDKYRQGRDIDLQKCPLAKALLAK